MNDDKWIDKIQQFCLKYDIPLSYLPEIIAEPKVIPMIRGKAFEFSAMLRLQKILPLSDWIVDKPVMNAQFGIHDMDVRVIHKATKKIIGIECKLAGKGTFKDTKDGGYQVKVKCMRSRTLGENKVKELAPKIGVTETLLQVHNDQYIPSDFNIVLTSIANAFYQTDEETDFFEWQPSEKAEEFLKTISGITDKELLQHFAYNKMYIADADKLAINVNNNIVCTRKQCTSPFNCGFIPNYPVIKFEKNTNSPNSPWLDIESSESLFLQIINSKKTLNSWEG